MINKQNIPYNIPQSVDFFCDCLQHCVYSRIDMIEDSSWRRVLSNKPIQWMFENFSQARELSFLQKNHVMDSENERWNKKSSHLETGFTIRINNTDYIFQMEIDTDYLEHFVKKYELNIK